MKHLIRRMLITLATLFLVVVGAAVWTTRPVAAAEPPMDPSYGAWCARVHAELFSHLPASMQEAIIGMHERHTQTR